MAGKLLDLVWELTTPADAPPELLASNALLDVLEGYAQHSLLQNYIARSGWVGAPWERGGQMAIRYTNCCVVIRQVQLPSVPFQRARVLPGCRCVTQLRSRQNVYTALTVLQNLLLLWAKMYGWQVGGWRLTVCARARLCSESVKAFLTLLRQFSARRHVNAYLLCVVHCTQHPSPPRPRPQPPDGRSQPPGGPWPLSEYLSKQLDHQFALSSLLVDGLCDFMGAAARWMEERQQGRGAAAGAAAPGAAAGIPGAAAGGVAGVGAGGSQGLVPPGQGCYSYQQIVRRYLEVFRLVSCSKEIWVDVRLVEALWDAVVLRPNTPEDMPTVRPGCAGGGEAGVAGVSRDALEVARFSGLARRARGYASGAVGFRVGGPCEPEAASAAQRPPARSPSKPHRFPALRPAQCSSMAHSLCPTSPVPPAQGLDLMLAVAGEDPAGPAAEGPAPGASWPFDGPLLSLSDMAAMLQGRMTALPPEHLPPPAFKCLAAWFEVVSAAGGARGGQELADVNRTAPRVAPLLRSSAGQGPGLGMVGHAAPAPCSSRVFVNAEPFFGAPRPARRSTTRWWSSPSRGCATWAASRRSRWRACRTAYASAVRRGGAGLGAKGNLIARCTHGRR